MRERRSSRLIFTAVIWFAIFFVFIEYQKPVTNFLLKEFIFKLEVSQYQINEYSLQKSYNYVQITDNFYPKNRAELINVIYTILDSGATAFNFFCDDSYTDCQTDIETISNDTNTLANINNFVHPYNSYNRLFISTNSMGKVTMNVEKLYSPSEIIYIKDAINLITSSITTANMSVTNKIRAFHDYIIKTTVYDEERSELLKQGINAVNPYDSHKANGVLTNHIALCGGYTDLMSIFLNNLGIQNYKVSTERHIWNALKFNGAWQMIDMTWDDPVTTDGSSLLIYDFFMISNVQLEEKKTEQHVFDKNIFYEAAYQ